MFKLTGAQASRIKSELTMFLDTKVEARSNGDVDRALASFIENIFPVIDEARGEFAHPRKPRRGRPALPRPLFTSLSKTTVAQSHAEE